MNKLMRYALPSFDKATIKNCIRRFLVKAPSKTLKELEGLPCTLPSFHPKYRHPTYDQIDTLVKHLNLSQSQVAKIVGVVHTQKGSPTVRRWKTNDNSPEHRKIPYSAWRILVEYSGLSSTDETKSAAEKYL